MKKTLVVMGVLGAISSFAFAESNVTLYGVIEEGVVVGKAKHQDATVQLQSGFDQGSRWGIKGVEDLGNGYSVGFILEQGFSSDDGTVASGSNGTTDGFTREAFMYVNSGFGKLGFGRTGALTFAQSNAILTGWAFGTGFGNSAWNKQLTANWGRINNVVSYATPVFGGFSAHLMYSNGMGSDTEKFSENNHYYGLGVLYNANNIKSSLVFEAGEKKASLNASDLLNFVYGADGWPTVAEENKDALAKVKVQEKQKTQYAITYGLEYNMGMVTPMFIYQYNWQSDGQKANIFGLSAKVNIAGGDLLVGARYAFGKYEPINIGADMAGIDKDDKIRSWNIGAAYIYPLSKRTALKAYAGYSDSSKAWSENTVITNNGYQVYLGMRHSF